MINGDRDNKRHFLISVWPLTKCWEIVLNYRIGKSNCRVFVPIMMLAGKANHHVSRDGSIYLCFINKADSNGSLWGSIISKCFFEIRGQSRFEFALAFLHSKLMVPYHFTFYSSMKIFENVINSLGYKNSHVTPNGYGHVVCHICKMLDYLNKYHLGR